MTMGRWNNSEVPLAYLITFRTYGTWLAGDVRGSIDRFHNVFRGPRAASSVIREQQQAAKLKSEPFIMNGSARRAVREAIENVCVFREWQLYALNVRTNHVHLVVAGDESSARILGNIKAYATRNLRDKNCWRYDHSPWVDKGSRRNLWNDGHIAAAVEYVLNGQGDELPEFD